MTSHHQALHPFVRTELRAADVDGVWLDMSPHRVAPISHVVVIPLLREQVFDDEDTGCEPLKVEAV
jgi:hypothetical protein